MLTPQSKKDPSQESITIMQKVEELKQWQRLYEARRDQTLDSPSSEKQGDEGQGSDMVDFSSPSMQLKAADNVHILDLDNGIHMIDELLNRIQRQSSEASNRNSTSPQTYPQPRRPSESNPTSGEPRTNPSDTIDLEQLSTNEREGRENLSEQFDFRTNIADPLNFRENFRDSAELHEVLAEPLANQGPNDEPLANQGSNDEPPIVAVKPKRPYLKRGEGLSRYRMTLNDMKKPVAKPSFALGRKKTATRPTAVPDRLASSSVRQSKLSSRTSESLSKAALSHLGSWSTVLGDQTPGDPGTGRPAQSSLGKPNTVQSLGSRNVSSLTHQPFGSNNVPSSTNVQSFGSKTVPSTNGQSLGARNVQMSPLTKIRTQMSMELDRRKKKETEEQKVFDLLEQKARDSSFNSTSSMVAKLMEDSVMSTPVKMISSLGVANTEGRIDQGSQVRFTDTNLCRTIQEVDESTTEDRTPNDFTIEQLPNHTEPDCECDSDSDTHYCSSDDDGPSTPNVDEAIRSYKPVLNRPYVDSGKTGAVTYSQLEEYLRLSQPLGALPLNLKATNRTAPAVQTNSNPVVKETKQLLSDIKRLAEERQRQESESDNKENERGKRTDSARGRNKRQGKKAGGFPMTVYQETYQQHNREANNKKLGGVGGLKSFGSDNPEPNPFECRSECDVSLELLKKRLGDLENEIHVFRLENIKLNKERKEFEKDRIAFTRAKKNSEKTLEEEKDAFRREMEDERNKLNKEKKVFLKYAKDAKNFPSKPEREELAKLKAELVSLKTDAAAKETKWAASTARLRNHIKVLEAQNQELKVQVEKLGKEAKKVSFASKKHISNTQIMNAINSQISKLTKTDVLPPPPPSILKKSTVQPANPGHSEPTKPPSIAKDLPSSYNLTTTPEGQDIPMPEDSFDKIIYQSLYSGDRTSGDREETPSRDGDVIPIESLNLGPPSCEYKEIVTADGTKEKHYSDGRQEIHYPNGNTVILSEAGKYIKTFYYNGDIKETDTADQTVRYFYSETNTWHTTHADGTEVLEFSNGQRETRLKDGQVEIEYNNGCRRTINKNGTELWCFDSGPVETVETLADGTRTLKLRNGQREVHTQEYKRREFPDGSVKLVYPDGIQETRYSNGRIRLKDGHGNLIMDSHEL